MAHNDELCACGHARDEHYNDSGAESFCHAYDGPVGLVSGMYEDVTCECEAWVPANDDGEIAETSASAEAIGVFLSELRSWPPPDPEYGFALATSDDAEPNETTAGICIHGNRPACCEDF